MTRFSRQIEAQIPRLRRYAMVLVRDAARADDLVQECLERAWQRRRLWKGGGELRAWLFTILHNLHANAARRAGRAPALVGLEEETGRLPGAPATQAEGLEFENLLAALDRLPEAQRQVVLLVGMEQMRYEEVAEILEIPLGTVMSRLFRGRERLRAMLAAQDSPPRRRMR